MGTPISISFHPAIIVYHGVKYHVVMLKLSRSAYFPGSEVVVTNNVVSRNKLTCSNKSCSNPGIKQCIKCHKKRYCCRKCQVANWKQHKRLCNIISSPQTCARLAQTERYRDRVTHLYQRGRQLDEALVNYRRALAIFQELLGENDQHNAFCYGGIGIVLLEKGQYEEALVEVRKSLSIRRELHGENNAYTTDCYEVIGRIFLEQGKPDDALIGNGKALAIRLWLVGDNHKETAYSYYNIGLVLSKKAQYNEALVSLRKAHEIFARECGEHYLDNRRTSESIEYALRKKVEQEGT